MKWAFSKESTQSQHDSGDHEGEMRTQTPAQGCSPHHSPCDPKAEKPQMPINDGQNLTEHFVQQQGLKHLCMALHSKMANFDFNLTELIKGQGSGKDVSVVKSIHGSCRGPHGS